MINARYCLSATLIAAVVTTMPILKAIAREAGKLREVTPRGQREAKDITFGSWSKLCFKAGGAPTLCRTSITGTFPTGQMAVRLDLIERDGDHNARLQVFV